MSIVLPKSLVPALKDELEREFAAESLEGLVGELAERLLRTFRANDLIAFFQSENDSLFHISTSRQQVDHTYQEAFRTAWCSSGSHDRVLADLSLRVASISYSSFSWPYPSSLEDSSVSPSIPSLPKDYTILIPFSQELTVSLKQEAEFKGYVVLLFDEFPQLNEAILQGVIVLPELLSSIFASFLRAVARTHHVARWFGHDVKHFLLLTRELLSRIERGDDALRERSLEMMDRALRRMLLRTSGLLLSERSETGRLVVNGLELDLNRMVEETAEEIRPLFDSAGVTIDLVLEPGLPPVKLDPAHFPTIVQNLLDNALKYSSTGQIVQVKTFLANDDKILLQVLDHGRGIPEAERSRIFSRFYRCTGADDVSGFGIGLFVAKLIAEAHGFTLYLDQAIEVSSCFTVEIPLGR